MFATQPTTRSFAEREGFEPPVQLPVHRISSAARSTTPASLLYIAGATLCFAPPRNFRFGTANIDIFFGNCYFLQEIFDFFDFFFERLRFPLFA